MGKIPTRRLVEKSIIPFYGPGDYDLDVNFSGMMFPDKRPVSLAEASYQKMKYLRNGDNARIRKLGNEN